MSIFGIRNPLATLDDYSIQTQGNQYWNLSPEELEEHTIEKEQGIILANGAMAVNTGRFTGRAPKDRFIVVDDHTRNTVDWGDINFPFEVADYDSLEAKIKAYLADKDVYIKDAKACADYRYELKIRLISEYPWSAQFAHNMFLRPEHNEIKNFLPDWTIVCAPGFKADPIIDKTRQENFAIINFSKKSIIIGGTAYTGEIKKGIFSVLNFLLPINKNVFPMHCSANIGADGDTAIFFGLSGTGKTTLSADPNRMLIGDDEHGWSDDSLFNFEGGCYAKCINLSEEKEPDIYRAVKPGAILENIIYNPESLVPDYDDDTITQNTRVSYPIYHITNSIEGSMGAAPQNIFFLTCDAFGILPPLSRLNNEQAMYYFMSGYTAKVAGTEDGIEEPQATFSACFGAPFLPLHPSVYAEMLGKKIAESNARVWLINTGWTGGAYGTGKRINLKYTRAMITAVLEGKLDDHSFEKSEIFNLSIPNSCPSVPDDVLNPRNTWQDKDAYDKKALELSSMFKANFEKYTAQASEEIKAAAPSLKKLPQYLAKY